MALLIAGAANAQEIEPQQLTDTGFHYHPSVSDDVVTWVGWEAGGYEILVANVASAFPAITPLTDNAGQKEHPSSTGGSSRIVWQARASNSEDWEIWIYDKNAIPRYRQFTDNDVPDREPSVGVGGNFAWLSGFAAFEAIHYWNEALADESIISDACCPTTTHDNDRPSYDAYEVIWRSYERGGSSTLVFWDGFADPVDGIPPASNPSLYDGSFAFEALVGLDRRIQYHDGRRVHEITDYEAFAPSLYDGRIAWQVWDGSDWEIEYFDGAEIVPVTDNDFDDTDPSLDGTTLAWVGRVDGRDEIFYATGLPIPEPRAGALALAVLTALAALRSSVGSCSRS